MFSTVRAQWLSRTISRCALHIVATQRVFVGSIKRRQMIAIWRNKYIHQIYVYPGNYPGKLEHSQKK